MSTLTFSGKQALLRTSMSALVDELSALFPQGSTVSWRAENSFVETGTVIRHEIMAGYPVLRVTAKVTGFYSIVTIADILRAQP